MKRTFRISFVVLVAALLLLNVAAGVFAGQPVTPAQGKGHSAMDENGNRIFDSLDKKLRKAGDNDTFDVIVMMDRNKGLTDVRHGLGVPGFVPKHEYPAINGWAGTLTKGQINALAQMPFITQIEPDIKFHVCLDTATHWFGADKVVTDFGYDGDRDGNPASYSKDDVVVAVIDTGIDPNHVDLGPNKIIAWRDYVGSQSTPYDDHGHGTHCSSIATGEGDGNAAYTGVAPGAALIGLKVLNWFGSGSMSDIDAAIQWCINNKDTYGIDIMSMSLGAAGSSDGSDSTSQLCNQAFAAGIVPVIAAGNEGPESRTIGSPGAAEDCITVGAFADVGEDGFNITDFSSRGPTADGRTKPDICAPGLDIMAADAGTTNGYVSYMGTSMATPFTAGSVALMLDANPNLTPAQVKDIIMNTAVDWGPAGKDIDYGAGRLQTYEAVKAAGSLSGTGPAVPGHQYESGSLGGSGQEANHYFDIADASYPMHVTLIMPNWSGSSSPNFNLYIYDPGGAQIATTSSQTRQDDVGVDITQTGTYRVRVYSSSGSGSYFLDVSAGFGAVDNPPTCSTIDPTAGQTIAGTYRIKVGASDDNGLDAVEVCIDSGAWVDITANFDGSHYYYDWDTTAVSDGGHYIDARATDTALQTTNATRVNVTVNNSGVDLPPSCSIADPTEGQTLGGSYRVKVGASDDYGLDAVEVAIDSGGWIDITANFDGSHYYYDWDTTAVSDGGHYIDARATDTAQQTTNATRVNVTVDNSTQATHRVTKTGSVSPSTPDAWLDVDVLSEGNIYLTLDWTQALTDLDFFVYAPDGTYIDRAYTWQKPETLCIWTDEYGTGRYQINVNLYSGLATDFTLTIDGFEKQTFTGYVDLLTPTSWESFNTDYTGNTYFSLDWDGTFLDDLDFYVYDPHDNLEASAESILKPETKWVNLDETGTWDVEVYMYWGIVNNYTLDVYVPEANLMP